MIIGIDASALENKKPTGVERYVRRLLEAMTHLPLQAGESIVLYGHGQQPDFFSLPTGWSWCELSFGYPGWTHLRLSFELFKNAPDIFFMPAHEVPLYTGRARVVTTVHDVVFAEVPQSYPLASRIRQTLAVRHAIKRAAKLLCVSEATKSALGSIFGVPSEHCSVAPLAADIRTTIAVDNSIFGRLNLSPQKYFIFVSRLEAKKDPATLVRAFAKLHREHPDVKLVLVGSLGFGIEEIERAIAESGCAKHIIRPGYLNDGERDALLASAAALCFPSLGEGFGLPALEALAFGTPVILSDLPVFHEVAGELGRYAPVGQVDAWARLMESVLEDDAWRINVGAAGPAQAGKFSWAKTAEITLATLREVYAR